MNDIYGKKCPYCKSEIKHGDDIVICSECNMPHHKQCWIENKGCTTFGCSGTIDTPQIENDLDFELTPDDFDMIRCNKCNKFVSNQSNYCEYCGNPFYSSNRKEKLGEKNSLYITLAVCVAVIILIIIISTIE